MHIKFRTVSTPCLSSIKPEISWTIIEIRHRSPEIAYVLRRAGSSDVRQAPL